MKGKKGTMVIIMLALFLFGCGAENKKDEYGFDIIVEDFWAVYSSLDEDGYRFDQVLEAVGSCKNGEIPKEEAIELLSDTMEVYQKELEGLTEFEVSAALTEQLKNYGILVEEYKLFGNSRESQIYRYKDSVSMMLECLENLESPGGYDETLRHIYEAESATQDIMRKYYYYGCLNYFFVVADDEELAYLKEHAISRIKSYVPEDPVWYDDKDKLEETVMLELDGLHGVTDALSENVGDSQEELYKMEKGYDEQIDAFEQYQSMEEKLEWLEKMNDRLEEIGKDITAAKEAGDEEKLAALMEEFEEISKEYEKFKMENEKYMMEDEK